MFGFFMFRSQCALLGKNVQRTCSRLMVDDCKTVNNVHFCYCNRPLCNGENAESIIEKLGDISDDVEDMDSGVMDDDNEHVESHRKGDDDDDGDDEASGNGGVGMDDEDYSFKPTVHAKTTITYASSTEKKEQRADDDDKGITLSVSTTQATINKAVNFNLTRNLLISCAFVNLINIYH